MEEVRQEVVIKERRHVRTVHRAGNSSAEPSEVASDEEWEEIHEELPYEGEMTFWELVSNFYYFFMNLAITLGAIGLLLTAYWIFKWGHCKDCCCNSCNHGSSYCAFPRFTGEDIGDPIRNFAFYLMTVGLINFCISYSVWANVGGPRMFLILPSILTAAAVLAHGMYGMKWLLCHPVAKPVDNLANWITMKALDTEHGRVSVYVLVAYMGILCLDMFVSFIHFCCFEQVEVEEEVEEPKIDISANTIVRPAAGKIAEGRLKTD